MIRILLDSTAWAIYGVNLDGVCTFVNRTFLNLTGYADEKEIIGKGIHELIHHSYPDGSPYPASMCKILSNERCMSNNDDETFFRRDGSSFPIEYWTYPIIENNIMNGFVVNFIDITEQKKIEGIQRDTQLQLKSKAEELQAAYDELKEKSLRLMQASRIASIGELSTGLAHEINQPLTEIMLLLYNLTESLKMTDLNTMRDFYSLSFDHIKKSGARIDKIIKHIRSFARQDVSLYDLTDVNICIKNVIENVLGEQLRDEGIDLITNFADLPLLLASQFGIEQVVINMMNNSRDAVKEMECLIGIYKKQLSISTTFMRESGMIEIFFVDNGIGICEQYRQKIFDPFFTTKETALSKGIGLTICSSIISNLNGTIDVITNHLKGTTFIISIPVSRNIEKGL